MCSIPGGEPESLENDISWIQSCVLRPQPGPRFPLLLLDSDSFNCIYLLLKESKFLNL